MSDLQSPPDVVVITARHEESIAAERAELLVTVQGSSLVTGRAALKKAKEVSALVEELERCGVTAEQIHLESVQAAVSSGLLGSSSSATYRLRIRCTDLERLPEILGAVTGARNARLDQVGWRYPRSAEQQARWLGTAVASANVKANAAAAALGTRVVGIHRLTEQPLEDENRVLRLGGAAAMGRARAPSEAVELGFDLGNEKRMGVEVTIQYRIEGFAPPAPRSAS
jgi:uncharacterized protein YggE